MTELVNAYAALEPKSKLQSWQYEAEPMGSTDIEIRVTHNGLCHTDLHMRDNDWGVAQFPLVPGHEVVGEVISTGDQVTHLKIGDRAGFGWIRDSCRTCRNCLSGQENICKDGYTGLILGHHGGFADRLRAPADFAYKIPETLSSAHAAPLLCAGITVYTPLRTYLRHPGTRVGVIGIGGLGHLAIKFARAMGAEVTAFSTSPEKEAEARQFGAHHFKLLNDASLTMGTEDIILNTAPTGLDWQQAINLLSCDGTLAVLGIPPAEVINLDLTGLIFGQKKVAGSIVGGRHFMTEMLEMAAVHQITPLIETMPIHQINEAMDRVARNEARYRIVLTAGNH